MQALLTTQGEHLNATVELPLSVFRQESTQVSFVVEFADPAIGLSLPRWNTNALHAPREGNSLAKIGFLRINGSYRYFAEVRKEHVEQLKLSFKVPIRSIPNRLANIQGIQVRDVAFKVLGWSIRYFMVIRDNYFGSFTHFSTLYEYLDKIKRGLPPGDPVVSKYREGKVRLSPCDFSGLYSSPC